MVFFLIDSIERMLFDEKILIGMIIYKNKLLWYIYKEKSVARRRHSNGIDERQT